MQLSDLPVELAQSARVHYAEVTERGPRAERKFPEHFLHIPAVVCGTKELWNIEELISIDKLRANFGHLDCVMVDLALSPEEVDRQRNEEVHTVKEYFEDSPSPRPPLLYMTEIYARGVCPNAAERPYPFCVFTEDNWFHTDIPGRLESFFLGNKGTFGIIHHDLIFGVGFLYMLSGVKRVVFFPPESEPLLAETFLPAFRQKHFPLELTEEDVAGIRKCKGQVALVHPGELLVIPQGWWHQITNLEDNSFSYVDMVLTKDHILNYCSTTEPEKFSLQHSLREIVPFRCRLAHKLAQEVPQKRARLAALRQSLKEALQRTGQEEQAAAAAKKRGLYGTGSLDDFSSEWDLVYGLSELHRGLSTMLTNLSLAEEIEEFKEVQRRVAQALLQLQQALLEETQA